MSDDPRILQLLQQALDSGRTPEEVCAGSPHLVEEVRAHLLRCRQIESQIDALFPTPVPTSHLRPSNPASTAFHHLPSHLQIPGYHIHCVLGRGGMGVVYKATHQALGRTVALKMMLSGAFAGPSELSRFKREARAVAGLNHSNIVQVYDVGEIDGRPFFTMEWVEGGSLAQHLAGVPQPALPSAALIQSLASAIQAAHDAGVVHRDLKPANILLRPDGTPRITDFGLARTFDDDDNLTRSGARVGTPSYMAPEQASGKPSAVGPPADVYALGAILYEMLTGRPPFRGESTSETERLLLTTDPVAPSRLNPKVPRDLQTICLTCLQKDPDRRYPSASALADDVARFRTAQPITARPAGRVERAAKWVRRHPSAAIVLTGSFLFVIALVAAAQWLITQRQSIAGAVADDLRDVRRLERSAQYPAASVSLERAKARIGSHHFTELESQIRQADTDLALVRTLDAIRLERANHPNGVIDPNVPHTRYSSAFLSAGISPFADIPTAASRIKQSPIRSALLAAIDDWTAVLSSAPDRQQRLQSIALLAEDSPSPWTTSARDYATWNDRDVLQQLANSAPLTEASSSLLNLLAQRLADNKLDPVPFLTRLQRARPDDFWSNFNLGQALEPQKPAEAVRYFQAAIALRPDTATPYNHLGVALGQSGRLEEAVTALERAAQLEPDSFFIHANYGVALGLANRHAEAVESFRTALRLKPDYVEAIIRLAISLQMLGRTPEAADAYTQALRFDPNSHSARTGLRDLFIRSGGLQEGWQLWKDLTDKSPANHDDWHGYPELCLFLHKNDDYRAARTALLQKFGNSTDPNVCERTGRACLLLPADPDELAKATALIDRALAADRSKSPAWSQPFFHFAKALAEYRAAHYAGAMKILTGDAHTVLGPSPAILLAMSHYQLGDHDSARKTLTQALSTFDWSDSTATTRETWIYHILRREAQSLIQP